MSDTPDAAWLADLVERTKGHTPPDWSVPHFATDLGCGCGYVFAREDAKTVCEVNYHDFRDKDDQHLPRAEATANARLIAAAPRLLSLAVEQEREIAALKRERDDWRDLAGNVEEQRAYAQSALARVTAERARVGRELRDRLTMKSEHGEWLKVDVVRKAIDEVCGREP